MTCNLDEEAQKLPHKYPYIMMVIGDSSVQFFVIAERAVVCQSDDFLESLLDLISVYFVYNIVYPKPMYPVLLFIQHYVMGIKDSQLRAPPALTRTISAFQ